jgi:hypothetical protein
MNTKIRTLAVIGLIAAAAFAVSACKWGKADDKPAAPAVSTAEASPSATPETSATPPVSGAAVDDAAAAAPASSAAKAETKSSK